MVSKAEEHPSYIAEAEISHGEVVIIVAMDIETIDNHLDDAREAYAGADGTPTTADNMESKVDDRYHIEVSNMFRKHEHRWRSKLDEINTTKDGIDVISGAPPFKSAPYRAGSKQREPEQFETDKQLQAAVIETSSSEWASPIPFLPKKDTKTPVLRPLSTTQHDDHERLLPHPAIGCCN